MPQILICFSRVVHKPQLTLDHALSQRNFTDELMTALDPNRTVTRYRKNWRFSQPKIMNQKYLVGKLGFISSVQESITDYDENQKDFTQQSIDIRQATFSQWAVDLSTQMIAFETKPPKIRFQSFIGAYKGILNQHPETGFTVEQILESAKFFDWVGKLDRITRFTASIRAPNPDFASRPRIIRELLEDTNAVSAKVELKSEQSLNTEKTIVQDLVDYGEDGYSRIVAYGEQNGHKQTFDSKREIATERIDTPSTLLLNVDIVWNRIIEVLSRKSSK